MDQEYLALRDSCPYALIYNNKESFYVKEYELINNGNVKAVYLTKIGYDTILIGGNFTITKIQ